MKITEIEISTLPVNIIYYNGFPKMVVGVNVIYDSGLSKKGSGCWMKKVKFKIGLKVGLPHYEKQIDKSRASLTHGYEEPSPSPIFFF